MQTKVCPICGVKPKDAGFRYCEIHFRCWRASPEFRAKTNSTLRIPLGQAHAQFEARTRAALQRATQERKD